MEHLSWIDLGITFKLKIFYENNEHVKCWCVWVSDKDLPIGNNIRKDINWEEFEKKIESKLILKKSRFSNSWYADIGDKVE